MFRCCCYIYFFVCLIFLRFEKLSGWNVFTGEREKRGKVFIILAAFKLLAQRHRKRTHCKAGICSLLWWIKLYWFSFVSYSRQQRDTRNRDECDIYMTSLVFHLFFFMLKKNPLHLYFILILDHVHFFRIHVWFLDHKMEYLTWHVTTFSIPIHHPIFHLLK